MITLDTSAIVALLDRSEPAHRRVRTAFVDDGGPFIVPTWILAETSYVIAIRVGARALDALLADLGGAYELDCGEGDVPRIRELVRRYADLPLGVADAAVIACAERSGGRVLSLDIRDFSVVAKEGKITVLP